MWIVFVCLLMTPVQWLTCPEERSQRAVGKKVALSL